VYYGKEDISALVLNRYYFSDQLWAQLGYSVGTAGDVNRDGYSDVILGVPLWNRFLNNEGSAWVFHGSFDGLSDAPEWTIVGGQSLAQFGYSVGTAGDVNGDGYSDVIIGAPFGDTNQGMAIVYEGSSSGLDNSWLWRKASGQSWAEFGGAVGTAGDVNGDGYADIIVGARLWNGDFLTDEGGAWIYLGSASGPLSIPDWYINGGQATHHFGSDVGTAGDVNADGYADVIVGAPKQTRNVTREGSVHVFFGNVSKGKMLKPRQKRVSSGSLISHLGRSDAIDSYLVCLIFRTPFGRGKVNLEVESKNFGQTFNGEDTLLLSGWHDTVDGTDDQCRAILRLVADSTYHWRVRLRYNAASVPFTPASRWVTVPWNGWNELDLRTGGYKILLPILLRD
jgi:hypothetical protein